jgi:hypothetical protein
MATITFDTLKFSNRLKAAGVPDKQVEAEAEALSEVLEVNLKDFATQDRFDRLESRFDQKLELLESRFDQKLEVLESRITAKLENARRETAETKAELVRWIVGAGFLQIALISALLLKLLPASTT